MENLSSNSYSHSKSNINSVSSSNITTVLKYNYKGTPLLYSTIAPRAYELTDIVEFIKEETNDNVIIEIDKNTMKNLMVKNKVKLALM